MKRGVIVEIEERLLTMLTPDGEFLQTKKIKTVYELGQEIDFIPIEKRKLVWSLPNLHLLHLKTPAIVAIALVLLFATYSVFNKEDKVYAYMSIDINPSIEVGVDKNLQVIELKPYNVEAELILNNLEQWKEEDLHVVVMGIIAESNRQGFLKDEKQVFIASVHHGKREKNIDKHLAADLQNLQTATDTEIVVTIVEGTEKDRENAVKNGLTTGKYLQNQEMLKDMDKSKHESKPKKEQTKIPSRQLKKTEPNMQEGSMKSSQNKGIRIQGENEQIIKSNKQKKIEKEKIAPGQQKKASKKNDHLQNNKNKMKHPENNLGKGKSLENKQKNKQNKNSEEDNRSNKQNKKND